MKVTFGKYKGQEVGDLPDHYLRWLAENITDDAALVQECEDQLVMREGRGRPSRETQ